MDNEQKWQFENMKDLYLNSFQRIITTATIINTGAILLIVNTLTSHKASEYILNICKFSFVPLKYGLFSFVVALFGIFYIVFTDFKAISSRFEKMRLNLPQPEGTIVKTSWAIGYISIICMIAGLIFSLLPVLLI